MIVSAYRGCRDAPPEYPNGVATLCGVTTKWFEIVLPYDVFRVVPGEDRPATFDKAVTAPLVAATTITRQAEHGQIKGPSGTSYFYLPNQGFEGEDQFTLQSIYKGQTFTLNYRIFVSADESKLNRHSNWPRERGQRSDCEKPPFQ
jgi:hypothetical protein